MERHWNQQFNQVGTALKLQKNKFLHADTSHKKTKVKVIQNNQAHYYNWKALAIDTYCFHLSINTNEQWLNS